MDRRQFLDQTARGAALAALGAAGGAILSRSQRIEHDAGGEVFWHNGVHTLVPQRPPAYSIIPVVGDGKWIWTDPPEEDRGYLEPRDYKLRVGIHLLGSGDARQIRATTTVPSAFPEQEIEDVEIETRGCEAGLRTLRSGASQLLLAAPSISAGQTLSAVATFHLTVSKQYFAYNRDQFPYQQEPSRAIRKAFLQSSPGIQTAGAEVKRIAAELSAGLEHPWDKAQAFHAWVPKHIKARIGDYTSVTAAIKNGEGDCEERSATLVALCRAVGIPARLVWVPNHNWSEIYLHDHEGKGHWIPVHTSCYPWFGWVGAHELVLQKGDRVKVPERLTYFRLLEDWAQWAGAKPAVRWTAELEPLPPRDGEDPGPGARSKNAQGQWLVTGQHELNKHMRI